MPLDRRLCECHQPLPSPLALRRVKRVDRSSFSPPPPLLLQINAGLDIEMPDALHFTEANIRAALANSSVTQAQIDSSCERILSGWYKLPAARRYPCGLEDCIDRNVSTAQNKALARKLSAMSTVLLKNEKVPAGASSKLGSSWLLPLAKAAGLKIALIGPDAEKPYTAGSVRGRRTLCHRCKCVHWARGFFVGEVAH